MRWPAPSPPSTCTSGGPRDPRDRRWGSRLRWRRRLVGGPAGESPSFGNGGAVLVNLTLTDANFGNSDPADDELTVTFNQIATWCNGDWRDIQQVGACVTAQALVHPDCFIPNNPFTFTRFSGLGETCE
jgi:hypothetical protein